jgi:hypothetical protein
MIRRVIGDFSEKKRLIRIFRDAGACGVDFARSLPELGVEPSRILRRLMDQGIVVHGGGRTYFLDERRLLGQRMTTVKWGMILLLLALFLLMQFVVRIR